MSAGHDHTHASSNIRSLSIALGLTSIFLVAEVVGGILTGSLALLSDAAHMMTDVMALIIAIMAIKIGSRPADDYRTYGYRRFEILAAVVNAVVLFMVAIYILYEAYERFITPPTVQSTGMMVIAAIGLVVNLICMRILVAGSDSSLNMKGAYLEVLADMLGSIGIIIAGAIIYFTGWQQVDPILAVLIGFWVVPRTWRLLSESVNILLEGVPFGVEIQKIRTELAAIEGVKEVHDLHVWAVTSGQNSLTAHIVLPAYPTDETIIKAAREVAKKHGITHTNFQVEVEPCAPGDASCAISTPHQHEHGDH